MGFLMLAVWAAIGYAGIRWWAPIVGAILAAPVVAYSRYERYVELFGAAEAYDRVIWAIATGIPMTAALWSAAYWLGRLIRKFTGGKGEQQDAGPQA